MSKYAAAYATPKRGYYLMLLLSIVILKTKFDSYAVLQDC